MATLTFLVMAFILLHQFLAPLYASSAGIGTKESGLLAGVLDIDYYASLLFWASVLESIFGGIVVGKIVDRNLSAGLQHSVILVVITLMFFNVSGV
jgi:flagellar protein FlaJ